MLAMGASCGVLAGAAEADTTSFCRPDLPQAQRTTAARKTQPRLRITRRPPSMSPLGHSLAVGAVRSFRPLHRRRRSAPAIPDIVVTLGHTWITIRRWTHGRP